MRRVSPENRKRLARLERAITKLPTAEQPLWRRRARALVDGNVRVRVAGGASGGWGAEDVAAAEQSQGVAWDLALANGLDSAYTAVSDRVVEVAKTGAQAVSSLGFNFMPLALCALAIGFAMQMGKGRA